MASSELWMRPHAQRESVRALLSVVRLYSTNMQPLQQSKPAW
jgi:hypothetical protein